MPACVTTYFLFVASFVRKLDFWPSEMTDNRTVVLMGFVTFPLATFPSVGALSKLAPSSLMALVLMIIGVWWCEPKAAESRTSAFQAFGDQLCIDGRSFPLAYGCRSVSPAFFPLRDACVPCRRCCHSNACQLLLPPHASPTQKPRPIKSIAFSTKREGGDDWQPNLGYTQSCSYR